MNRKDKIIKTKSYTNKLQKLVNKEKRNFIKKIIIISQLLFVPISFKAFKRGYTKVVKNNDLNWILNNKDL